MRGSGTCGFVSVTIYHNPDCGTSRNVLALIRNSGEEPRIIEYLKAPPARDELKELIRRMDMPVRGCSDRKEHPTTHLVSAIRHSRMISCWMR